MDIKQGDITIKKGKFSKTVKKKEESQISKGKGNHSKLKNVKSEKKFLKKKTCEQESIKKITKKLTSPMCKNFGK